MPDITMCSGEGCALRDTCRRFLAEPSRLQSYFIRPPVKDGQCSHYWPILRTPPSKSQSD
jgi:hypothetical protein